MKVLITGATGLLGKSLIQRSRKDHSIFGIYVGGYFMHDSANLEYHIADIQNTALLKEVVDPIDIDVVIHTAGIADVDACERDYEAAYQSNVIGSKNVIELCRKKGARLVYISTNAVFDGEKAPYSEDDRVNPINRYGAMKLECENMVARALKDSLIVRPILMYGWNHESERKNLVTALLDKLGSGHTVNIVNDIYDNPLCAYSCAEAMWTLIEKGLNGIYHIAGRDIVSRYEYALTIADVFGLDQSLIKPVDSSFFPNIAPRPKNTSYKTTKLERDIGFVPLGLREGLLSMKSMRKGQLAKLS